MTRERLRVGLAGAGFIAGTHVRSLRACVDPPAEVVAVAARRLERAQEFAARYQIPDAYDDVRRLIERPDIDVIDLCVPNNLHAPFAIAAAEAGKHVIVEKPLTGYFGGPGATEPVGKTPKRVMFEEALRSADAILAAAARTGVQVCYAENLVYAPAVQKAKRLIQEAGGAILEIRCAECHSGSHAQYAKRWAEAGGGALLRLGSHPIGTALHLKRFEGMLRDGRPIEVAAVTAQTAALYQTPAWQRDGARYLVSDWEDVENWSVTILTFTDGTRAVCLASDVALGGVEDSLQLLLSTARININFTHSTMLQVYAPSPDVFRGEPLQEKLHTNAGWSFPPIEEELVGGYRQEMQDFLASIAAGRAPVSDGALGRATVEAIYAAYVSAEEERTVRLR
jgi:predicted dehydrogenase